MVGVRNNGGTTRWLIKGDGNVHGDTSATALDDYDDAALVRAFDLECSSGGVIDGEFDRFVRDRRSSLERAGIVAPDGPDGAKGLTCYTRLWKLHNGAIWQGYVRTLCLVDVLHDLVPGFSERLKARLDQAKLPALPVLA